jgi:hypothetical protein
MKLRLILLIVAILFCGTSTFAQVEDSTMPPAEVPEEITPPATDENTVAPTVATAKPRVAPPVRQVVRTDTIKGNGRNDVELLAVKSSCGELTGVAIKNKASKGVMMVRVDVSVVFSGRMSKKSTLVDNLGPNEVRSIGCTGCIEKSTGKACTTYKIIAAQYK